MADISWITEQIAISGVFLEEDIIALKEKGVDAIIDLRSEDQDNKELIEKSGMSFLHVGVDDRYAPSLKQLQEIFDFALPLLDEGKKILIHCQNSCGRSPLVAAAVLAKRGMDIASAVGLVEEKHPLTGFSEPQQRFVYMDLREYLKESSS